jgi:lipoprotein-releasing system permease protein
MIEPEMYDIVNDEDVVIGSDLAYQLGVFIGDQIVMTPPETLLLPQGEIPSTSRRVIQDVIRTGVQSLDGQFILYTKDKGSLFKDSVSHEVLLEVYLTHPKLLDEVLKKIPAGYKVETWRERNSALFYSLKMEKNLITFFLLLSILVGSFSIVTILILLATQKRQEIAVLLTLGLSQRRISKMFTHIGFFISSLGVFVGFFLGLVVCLFLDSTTLIQLPDIYYDRSLPVKFVPEFYMLVLVLSLLIALFSSNLPARWFLRFTPQDILRKNFKS